RISTPGRPPTPRTTPPEPRPDTLARLRSCSPPAPVPLMLGERRCSITGEYRVQAATPAGDWLDKQCVLVFGAAGSRTAGLPAAANRVERGTQRFEQSPSFACRSHNRCLHGVEGLIDPDDQIGEQRVDPLDLRGSQSHRPRGIATDGVEM